MSSSSSPMLCVASIPLRSRRGEPAQNVARIAAWLALAARDKVDLAVFPEACLVGYGSLAKLHRDELEALAEPLDGPMMGAVADAVERTGVAAGVGFIERSQDGRLFNSYAVCLPGGVRHCHRKLHAYEHRRIVSGDRFTVFDTAWGVRVGVLIGGDAYLIENVRMTALMGATLLVAPHRSYSAQRGAGRVLQPVSAEQWRHRGAQAGAARATGGAIGDRTASATLTDDVAGEAGVRARRDAEDWLRAWLPARAADNGIFAVFCDGLELGNNEFAPGAGMIVDPCGRILTESVCVSDACIIDTSAEGVIVAANVDPGQIATSAGQQWLRARRPDLYAPLGRADRDTTVFESRGMTSRGSIAVSFAQVSRR
ncbi:putative amidohydrolase [Paraburkholderia sp. GAS206C]|uniref:nitrilase-related carbon-nitrogen hydrolase n=1 Tax=unclassified Paraburkholderia TaxID=2615204 RepID=UPI003D22E8B2